MAQRSNDASFSDGDPAGGPLALRAESAEDLAIISTLVQDSVLTAGDITRDGRARRFALLLSRFRWEDADAAEAAGRPYERVRSLLVISDVTGARTDGIDRNDADLALSLLRLEWLPGEDGTGRCHLIFSGDGVVELDVECLNVDLRDVTRPYVAPSGQRPHHDRATLT